MTTNNIDFARQLVKGKIAETIFAQMFRTTGKYTVLEFGYEKVIPELVQSGYDATTGIIETLRTAPDFAVIDIEQRHVKLVEVKYRRHMQPSEVLETARRMHQSWNPSYLFICTLDGFYFDEIENVLGNAGGMRKLNAEDIPEDVQAEFLKILQDFENGK